MTRRGEQYIGLLSLFHVHEYVETPYEGHPAYPIEKATCDTQLAVSRDGLRWERVADRQTFLPFGAPRQWDYGFVVTSSNIVFDGDRMLFYYASRGQRQGDEGARHQIGVALSLRDRFHALRPRKMHQEAVIEMRPQYLKEGDLRINANASYGRILVEICDFNGVTIQGFSKEECTPITGDGLDQVVRWHGGRLSDAVNSADVFRRAIRIRFYIHHASLYAAYLPKTEPWE